jgi:hypothetical protein
MADVDIPGRLPEGRAEAYWELAKRALSYPETSVTAVEKPMSRKRVSTPRAKKAKTQDAHQLSHRFDEIPQEAGSLFWSVHLRHL